MGPRRRDAAGPVAGGRPYWAGDGERMGRLSATAPRPGRNRDGVGVGLSVATPAGADGAADQGGTRRRDDRRHYAGVPRARDEPSAELLRATRGCGARRSCGPRGARSASGRGGPTTSTCASGTGSSGRRHGVRPPDDLVRGNRGVRGVLSRPDGRLSVDDELAVPQPGGFYGGWVTADIAGPVKGGPGARAGSPPHRVGMRGFEPRTSCSQSRRAAKLRHIPCVVRAQC